MIPHRQSSGLDLLVDMIGILVALMGYHLLSQWWPRSPSTSASKENSATMR
jgi:hypothetical protein